MNDIDNSLICPTKRTLILFFLNYIPLKNWSYIKSVVYFSTFLLKSHNNQRRITGEFKMHVDHIFTAFIDFNITYSCFISDLYTSCCFLSKRRSRWLLLHFQHDFYTYTDKVMILMVLYVWWTVCMWAHGSSWINHYYVHSNLSAQVSLIQLAL